MTREVISRRPQEGTYRYIVYKKINGKPSPWDRAKIAQETGSSRKDVSIAIANLRNGGYLQRPSPEETRQSRQLALGHILLPAKPYREMGMSIREVQLSLLIKDDKDFTYEQIHGAVGWGTRSGSLRGLSKEEKKDIKIDSLTLSDEEVFENISNWLKVKEWLSKNIILSPTNRLEWKKAIEDFQAIKKYSVWADWEDEKGLFVYRNGKKYYQFAEDGEGNRVYDNSKLARKRWESRHENEVKR